MAIADFDDAIYITRASIYVERRKFEPALADLDKATSLDAASDAPFNGRGNLHNAKREYDLALAEFAKAIALKPDNPKNYFDRGYVNILQKDHTRALADFETALSHSPLLRKQLTLSLLSDLRNTSAEISMHHVRRSTGH